jgi:serine phosphatase RsbU (regulator of sigma subunit)
LEAAGLRRWNFLAYERLDDTIPTRDGCPASTRRSPREASMETSELQEDGTIRDFVASCLQSLQDSYSMLNAGYITQFPEPIHYQMGIQDVLQTFAARGEPNSLPVEGESGVIGIVNKRQLIKKKTTLMSVTNPPVEKFIDYSGFSVNASENCEQAMTLLLARDPESLYDDFMIYERGRYFGTGTFSDLSRNISKIRQMDLEKAKKAQEFLMSRYTVSNPGIAMRSRVRMAHELGGDYLHCMDLSPDLSLLACFDVCGKGTGAALLTAAVSTFFSTLKTRGALDSITPAELVSALNHVVMDQTPDEVFVASAMAFVDIKKREATFYNCGFPPIYLFYEDADNGKPKGKIINPNLWPLGINDFQDPQGSRHPLYPKMRIFMHSDGLTDAKNERDERYGDESLRKYLFPRAMKNIDELMKELDAEIEDYVGKAPQADDIIMLLAELG